MSYEHNCILLTFTQVMTISPNTEFLFSHNLLCWLMKSQALATTLASWTTGSCSDNNGINLCIISETKSVHTAQLFINVHSCLYSWWQLLIFLKYTHKPLNISHLLHEILVLLHPTSPHVFSRFPEPFAHIGMVAISGSSMIISSFMAPVWSTWETSYYICNLAICFLLNIHQPRERMSFGIWQQRTQSTQEFPWMDSISLHYSAVVSSLCTWWKDIIHLGITLAYSSSMLQ